MIIRDQTPIDVMEDAAAWLISDGMRAWPFMHPGARRYGLLELYDPLISDWMSSGPEWHSVGSVVQIERDALCDAMVSCQSALMVTRFGIPKLSGI